MAMHSKVSTIKLLITGTCSGLGKYLHENMGGIELHQSISEEAQKEICSADYDAIIHCAANSSTGIDSTSLYSYLDDNLFLTKRLTSIRPKLFVYMSSVDVYPQKDCLHSEDQIIDADTLRGIYATTKLASETLIQHNCPNYLILRGVTLLGKYSRKNTLIKIIENEKCEVGLSGDSIYNITTYFDIKNFIQFALEKNFHGIYNLASSDNIKLSDIAGSLNRKVQFGTHIYRVGNIDNRKIASVFPRFKKSSLDSLLQYTNKVK